MLYVLDPTTWSHYCTLEGLMIVHAQQQQQLQHHDRHNSCAAIVASIKASQCDAASRPSGQDTHCNALIKHKDEYKHSTSCLYAPSSGLCFLRRHVGYNANLSYCNAAAALQEVFFGRSALPLDWGGLRPHLFFYSSHASTAQCC